VVSGGFQQCIRDDDSSDDFDVEENLAWPREGGGETSGEKCAKVEGRSPLDSSHR